MAELKIKRVVVAGCRNYNNYKQAKAFIDECLTDIKNDFTIIIISGGASGADRLGERYAFEHGYKIKRYPANWIKYGRSAGPRRNKLMAQVSDLVICFWDGESRGTKSMIEFAKQYNKPLKVKTIDTQEGL